MFDNWMHPSLALELHRDILERGDMRPLRWTPAPTRVAHMIWGAKLRPKGMRTNLNLVPINWLVPGRRKTNCTHVHATQMHQDTDTIAQIRSGRL